MNNANKPKDLATFSPDKADETGETGISCWQSTEILSLWRDEQANPHEISLLEAHIAQCPACQRARPQFLRLFVGLDAVLNCHE